MAARAGVSAATAKRIRAAIDATGYVPNLIAGGLASNRSRLLAVPVPDLAQSIFIDTIEAMTSELARDGNTVMLGLTGADNAHMVGQIDAATRRRLRQRGLTVIETWGMPDEPIDAVVGFSHLAAGREIAALLLGRGYALPVPTRLAHARAVWHQHSESAARQDVIVCSSDLLAQGVIIEALSAGLRVPRGTIIDVGQRLMARESA